MPKLIDSIIFVFQSYQRNHLLDPARLNEALIGRNGPDEANAEYKSLQKRHKRYLILALISVTILAAGCVACAVVAVVLGKQKADRIAELESKIQQMEKQKADAETNKHLNLSFLQIKNLSIDFQPASIINDDQSSIKAINLTHNLIQEFRDNNIPSLTELVLAENPISNFINNSLPELVNLTFPEKAGIKSFTGNSLFVERLGGELTITNFSGNTLPKLKQLSNQWNDQDSDGVKFHHNNIPLLTSLQLIQKNLTVFKSNNLSSLESLTLSNNSLADFDVSAPQLRQLNLHSNNLSQFSNFNLPTLESLKSLKSLQISYNRLTRFENNQFTRLEELNLGYNSLSVLAGNDLPAIKTLDASSNNLSDISNNTINPNISTLKLSCNKFTSFEYFINSFQHLSELRLDSNPIPSVIGYQGFSNLATLSLGYCNMSNFSNNQFSSLKILQLSANSISSFESNNLSSIATIYLYNNLLTKFALTEPSSNSLQSLELSYNSLTAFSNYKFPNLTALYLPCNNLQEFKNNTFQHLQVLLLGDNPDLSSIFQDDNHFQRLQWLDISGTNVASIQGQSLKALEYMDASVSKMAKFENNQFPSLTKLYLSNCSLSSFANNTIDSIQQLILTGNYLSSIGTNHMQSVQVLYLSINNFGDDVGDQIVNLRLVNLQTVVLRSNDNIKNRTLVAQKIRSVAPNVQIVF